MGKGFKKHLSNGCLHCEGVSKHHVYWNKGDLSLDGKSGFPPRWMSVMFDDKMHYCKNKLVIEKYKKEVSEFQISMEISKKTKNIENYKILETKDYFKKDIDQLLEIRNEYGYTREECLIFDEGVKAHFCDDENEFKEFLNDYKDYDCFRDMKIKCVLKTINERLAIILI